MTHHPSAAKPESPYRAAALAPLVSAQVKKSPMAEHFSLSS
jgi:hypothetical protein